MPKTLTLLIAAGALGAAVSGCGSSSRAPGIVTAPGGGATAASTTATVSTPTSGPLSKEPTITKPTAPAPSKLVTKNLITGTGKTAEPGDTIVVNYVGAVYKTGKVFDASWKRGTTFTTKLTSGSGGVIEGWVKGIAGMKVGGRRQLIIPPSLAYGKQAQAGIPANSTLIFDVDLLKVSK
ncbi:MAG TPA: FKBP-type peptidyl-prolyl cis-trans isomerase [Solirubrobacteraceae bacterium]|nr:FKBP-type peptidyl-prolyl cis-trans isomerase [Solirubrobacteraceae bacterium]